MGAQRLWADAQTREIQEALRKRHLFLNDINGEYSPTLATAIKQYQIKKGFRPTGIPDRETLASLGIVEPAPPVEDPPVVAARHNQELRDQNGQLLPDSPSAVTANPPRPLDRKPLHDFVPRYLAASQSRQLPDELSFYGASTTGPTDNSYVLRSREDGDWKITGIKEETVKKAAPRSRRARIGPRVRTRNPIVLALHSFDRAMRNLFGEKPATKRRVSAKRL